MSREYLISIITVVKNAETTIEKCIKSVLNQKSIFECETLFWMKTLFCGEPQSWMVKGIFERTLFKKNCFEAPAGFGW